MRIIILLFVCITWQIKGQSILFADMETLSSSNHLPKGLTSATTRKISTSLFQNAVPLPSDRSCAYGYLEYLPSCQTVTENCNVVYKCPTALLINLHGWGARGNGTTELPMVANEGVARLIKDGVWSRPEFIVISPQLSLSYKMYPAKTLYGFINQMVIKYGISNVYIVGLSGGANSIYPYVTTFSNVRAAIAISGSGPGTKAYKARENPTIIWEFHGDKDGIVPYNTSFHRNYNLSADSVQAEHSRYTLWNGVSHTGWQQVYSGEWIKKESDSHYDKFEENVFDWLLKY